MAQLVTLDVIDHPSGGAPTGGRALREIARRHRPAGCLAMIPCATARFHARPWPYPTPRRIALLSVWEDPEAAAGGAPVGALTAGAREHWHVLGEVAHASGRDPWGAWTPAHGDARPLGADEPVLVLISGELKPRHVATFLRDSARAVAHADASPGYLGGLALASSPMNTTSCSAWRTAADSRAYAFKAGHHAEAMKRDRSGEHHRTERFVRVRPLASHGTVDGRDPFAGVVGAAVAA